MESEIAERRQKRELRARAIAEDIQKLAIEADADFKSAKYIEACDRYLKATETYGPRPILMSGVAACFNKLEDFLYAEDAATVALEYNPRDIRARFERALARKHLQFYQAALKDLESILAQEDAHSSHDAAKAEIQEIQKLLATDEGYTMDKNEEEHPHFTDPPWTIVEDLDEKEDQEKRAYNTRPCHAYNHGSCKDGRSCKFKHDSDDDSVRDELGRNVCAAFLMDTSCPHLSDSFRMKEVTVCPYSHSTEHLPPDGWWATEEGIESAQDLSGYKGEDFVPLHSAMQRNPIASAVVWKSFSYAACMLHFADHLSEIRPYDEADELGEPMTYDWSSDEEKYMAPYMARLNPVKAPGNLQMPPDTPFALALTFDYYEDEDNLNRQLFNDLSSKILTVHPRKYTHGLEMAIRFLDSPNLAAVLVTDPEVLSDRKYMMLLRGLRDYVRNGGRLVFGGNIANHLKEFDKPMEHLFRLPWRCGDYHGNSYFLNPSNEIAPRNPGLDPSFHIKAMNIAHIQPEEAVYVVTAESRYPDDKRDESPAVCTRVGSGLLGFMGDVNNDVGSRKTVLAMLGLLTMST